jgi:hypothetical protein
MYNITLNNILNHINGVMLTLIAVNNEFEPHSGQIKDYTIGICCFSASLRRKIKDWLAWNQDNVSEWSHMSIHRLMFE